MSKPKHGMASTPEWRVWVNLARHGEVNERWRGPTGFQNFLADVGPRPSAKHQLHRPDISRPAAPDNYVWIVRGVDKLPPKGRGRYRHGAHGTPTWNSWMAMCRRCDDPNNNRYYAYGARGITVCDRWRGRDGFSNFIADMGEKPADTSIDRIDVNSGYSAANCRWATRKQQARNTRATKLEEHEPDQIRWLLSLGYTQTEIARFFEVSQSTVSLIALGKTWTEDANV